MFQTLFFFLGGGGGEGGGGRKGKTISIKNGLVFLLGCTDTDSDTAIRQFLKNKNTTQRGHNN